MSVARVLAAAAALREFTTYEVAAFCDEPESVVAHVLEASGGSVTRLPGGPDAPEAWRVRDPGRLRRAVAAARPTGHAAARDAERDVVEVHPTTRLRYAEETLLECGGSRSPEERRILLATAENHLRQVVADLATGSTPWWDIELLQPRLGALFAPGADPQTATRVQLDLEVALLTGHDVSGRPAAAGDLLDAVRRVQPLTAHLDLASVGDVAGRFVDLVAAQAEPGDTSGVPAPGRLLMTVACRRVRTKLGTRLDEAVRALEPVLRKLGRDDCREPELYRLLRELPDGRQHVVVYSDLLQMLPNELQWSAEADWLPGALTEAVTVPATTALLRRHADILERDLHESPYGSASALIGSAVHVFRRLADEGDPQDDGLRSRSDRTCSELLTLARVPV